MAMEKCHSPQLTPLLSSDSSQTAASEEDEDEEAFTHQALLYESGLQREDLDTSADGVFSVAPGEGQKPIAILTDEHFEEMCNPSKYPTGLMAKNGTPWLLVKAVMPLFLCHVWQPSTAV